MDTCQLEVFVLCPLPYRWWGVLGERSKSEIPQIKSLFGGASKLFPRTLRSMSLHALGTAHDQCREVLCPPNTLDRRPTQSHARNQSDSTPTPVTLAYKSRLHWALSRRIQTPMLNNLHLHNHAVSTPSPQHNPPAPTKVPTPALVLVRLSLARHRSLSQQARSADRRVR